ncbi:MAG: hypothetical protein AB4426_28605 [Xenococcaceae cyanobacterium]
MTKVPNKRKPHRGRIFPEYTIPPEELARQKSEQEARGKRYRAVFEQVQPELITNHYNWFIVIEPNSGDYLIDPNEEVAIQKARQKYPRTPIQ